MRKKGGNLWWVYKDRIFGLGKMKKRMRYLVFSIKYSDFLLGGKKDGNLCTCEKMTKGSIVIYLSFYGENLLGRGERGQERKRRKKLSR